MCSCVEACYEMIRRRSEISRRILIKKKEEIAFFRTARASVGSRSEGDLLAASASEHPFFFSLRLLLSSPTKTQRDDGKPWGERLSARRLAVEHIATGLRLAARASAMLHNMKLFVSWWMRSYTITACLSVGAKRKDSYSWAQPLRFHCAILQHSLFFLAHRKLYWQISFIIVTSASVELNQRCSNKEDAMSDNVKVGSLSLSLPISVCLFLFASWDALFHSESHARFSLLCFHPSNTSLPLRFLPLPSCNLSAFNFKILEYCVWGEKMVASATFFFCYHAHFHKLASSSSSSSSHPPY